MSASVRFSEARLKVLSERETVGGIGTLSEKLLHKILKFYADPDDSHHEIPVLGSVADVKNADGITEIQTRCFEKLVPKLEKFLREHHVSVVLPLVNTKYISYIDRESGELISRRKSTKRDSVNRAACELYKIASLIPSENLSVRLIFLDFDEYRYPKEKGYRRKPSEDLIECVPSSVASEILLKTREDYRIFLPDGIGEHFRAAELARLIKLDSRRTHNTLRLLMSLGMIERTLGENRAYIYTVKKG